MFTAATMDALISSAVEEICYRGSNGITLSLLWSSLTISPSSPSAKASLWSRLLQVPNLEFYIPVESTPLSSTDPRIQLFEDAERIDLKIVAREQLRDSFAGLYDIPSNGISDNQLRTLRRLAVARGDGMAQNQLAKELGIENNKFFYVVKNLECLGLITKRSAVVKTRDSVVTTNLLYLRRYAKHLGIQQRLEIKEEDLAESDVAREGSTRKSFKDNVFVRDYLPAMEAVCDKLESAKDKVLVVSDIKQNLGYSGIAGHRAWRNICRRLKDAGLVEEFEAKVNEKVQRCLRLLKKLLPKISESQTHATGNGRDKKELMKFGRRIQGSEQLVELSLDQQIYDIIDAEGTEGTTYIEIVRRLGLDQKRSYSRIDNMVSRFGMHKHAENHLKTQAFRVWTSGNSNSKYANAFLCKSKIAQGENKSSNLNADQIDVPDRSNEPFLSEINNSQSQAKFAASGKSNKGDIDTKISHASSEHGKANPMNLSKGNAPELAHEPRSLDSSVELNRLGENEEVTPLDTTLPTPMIPTSRSSKGSQYPLATVNNALREQRILERLQDEKFILRAELHRWLMSLEKNKCTMMDRKTVDRILNKLQQQGHCRCVVINVPVVTNCGRNRTTLVVLHPSVQDFPPEMLGEIHEKLRSFEKQIRSQGSSRWKTNESVPILNDVTRTHSRVISDEKAVKAEAMRTNGFVLAKMGRARLLHKFLWGHLSGSTGGDSVLSSGANSCTYKLFSLEAALKAIPIELFLQVVGSTQKYDDMIEKCKKGLCLADLPVDEYKSLMDTHATGRLSLIIDILRRLKLIQLIRGGHSEDGVKVPHATFTDALELKPYVEEPVPVFAISNLISLDLRPRIKHDFILSSKEAVDEYWKTLEYCFAAAHPRAAKHAFPGSAVHEVFHHRSWTSVRVMSADQRAELLKRVVKDDVNKTLSYKDCGKIAKDLNLTLQQVLRVFYDNHNHRLKRFQSSVNADEEEYQPPKKKNASSSNKRENSLEERSNKLSIVENVDEQFDEEGIGNSPNVIDPFVLENDCPSSGEHDDHFPAHQMDVKLDTEQDTGQNGKECHPFVSQNAASKTKPTRISRFSWTDETDRQLVIQYARHRAVLGPKVHRLDWSKIPDLPAAPRICARKMASLNQNKSFRKALMKLCTILGDRYAKHLVEIPNMYPNDSDCRGLVQSSKSKGPVGKLCADKEGVEDAGYREEWWDDFNDKDIKKAFEHVIYCKRLSKSKSSKRDLPSREEWSDLDNNAKKNKHMDFELVSSKDLQSARCGNHKDSARRSRYYQLQQNFLNVMNGGTSVSRKVHKLLAVSNAVELLKLVLLSTSTAQEQQDFLSDTLRRYSEYDIFAAFSYLREKKIMIGGSGDQPFVLSQQFLHSVSKSPFPANTGKRALKFSSWLHEREKDLVESRIDLSADLQCGDIFQLFALVSSGELSISPRVPDEGVGEVEDFRSSKRKAEDDDLGYADKAKKLRSLAESELVSRREKGFPGIMVAVHRSAVDAFELLTNVDIFSDKIGQDDQFNARSDQEICRGSSHSKIPNFDVIPPSAAFSSKSPWEAMAHYSEYLLLKRLDSEKSSLINPEVFRALYTFIQKAGDQGLSVEEVYQFQGENMQEHVIDVLQAFGRVMKVNAYESVRIVDSLYRSKYFLTSMAGFSLDLKENLVSDRGADGRQISHSENYTEDDTSSHREVINDDVHRVTILNLPEEIVPLNEAKNKVHEGHLPEYGDKVDTTPKLSSEICMPIVPWINGDGTVNKSVYNGLVRHVLGTVMQNPGILEVAKYLRRSTYGAFITEKEEIIRHIDVLNPQTCRSLLELMILDKHIIVRKMCQSTSCSPPALLQSLFKSSFQESKLEYREHFFANPSSTSLL